MAVQDDGSVTRWIGDLKAGGDSAAQHLWERCSSALSISPAATSAWPAGPGPSKTRRMRH